MMVAHCVATPLHFSAIEPPAFSCPAQARSETSKPTTSNPAFIKLADIADPMNLQLRTLVNGKVTQQGNTRDMIFNIPALIAYLSDFMTLSPGDIILTGTPEGLADVKVGDEVVTEIEGIGSLKNTIIGDPQEHPYVG